MVDASGNVDFEYLILGAGPAGLQLGHHLSRAGRSYLILERGDCAEGAGLNVRCNTHVARVQTIHKGFRLHDAEGNAFTCRRLLVAAGLTKPHIPDVPGTGLGFDSSFFDDDCRPELAVDDRFPALTCEWESTNVPGMYFAGALTQSCDFKKGPSGFIHGFRYNTRALFRMLEKKYHAKPWPAQAVEPTSNGILRAMIERINESSAMWQQSGFLHDLIVMPDNGGPARHYQEMPLAYIQETELSASSHYYTVTMEHGAIDGDPFAPVPDPIPQAAPRNVSLRPVIRRWNGPLLVTEHRLPEDLFGEWKREDLHFAPLREFLQEQMRERVRVLTGWS